MEASWERINPYLFGVWLNIDGYLNEPTLASYGLALELMPLDDDRYFLMPDMNGMGYSYSNVRENPLNQLSIVLNLPIRVAVVQFLRFVLVLTYIFGYGYLVKE